MLPRWEAVMLQKFDPEMRIGTCDHNGVSHRLGGLCATAKCWCATQSDPFDPSARLTEVHPNENLTPIREELQSDILH